MCKTPPLLRGMRKVVYKFWSHALLFGWATLPLAEVVEAHCYVRSNQISKF